MRPPHHHAYAIAECESFFLIVRYVNCGQAEAGYELAQFATSFLAQGHVKIRKWLIKSNSAGSIAMARAIATRCC